MLLSVLKEFQTLVYFGFGAFGFELLNQKSLHKYSKIKNK